MTTAVWLSVTRVRAAGCALLLAMFAWQLAAGSAWASTQALQRTQAGHLATEVLLQGHAPVLFNVDTGAATSALYEPMRRMLGLHPEAGARTLLVGAGGSHAIERYRLPLLTAAGVQRHDLLVAGLPVGVSHGDEVRGIVGGDVLSRHVVEFDLRANRFGLHPPGTMPASAAGWDALPFRMRQDVGLIEIHVRIGGTRVRAVLDTGARTSLVNWLAAGVAGISADSPALERGIGARGATMHTLAVARAPFPDVVMGLTRFARPNLAIADLPVFDALGMASSPAMILGLDLLENRRFVVDYPNSRVLFERPSAEPTR